MRRGLVLFFLLMAFSLLTAEWVEIQGNQSTERYTCDQQSRGTASIEFNLDGYEVEIKNYDGIDYTYITYPESSELLETGMPDLPIFTKALIIPNEGNATIEIISFEQREYKDVLVYPQEALQFESEKPRDNFVINTEFYQGRGIYPSETAWTGEPAIMRDFRVLPVIFSPFQYEAGSRTLKVCTNIRIQVTVEGTGGINAKYSDRKRSRAFEEMYRTNTLNYDRLSLRDEYQVPTILFICNDNDDVLENLAYLTDWKRQKGFNVVVATTSETGTSNTSIKDYIQDAYDNWENPPEYVNIIGDGAGSFSIATWYTSGMYGEGDHPYSQLEGNDILGDVIMGRMTFSTITGLQTVISKALTYEKTPYMGNTDWYSRACLTGDPNSSGYSCVAFAKSAKELMLDYPGNFWGDDNFEEVYSSNFSTQMNAAVNLGVSYFAYRGYGGTSGWYSGSTSNGYMMPFIVMPTCGSNNWQAGTGNVENFYQMGSVTLPSGGIGGFGTATSSTHTPFNNAIAIGVMGGIFYDYIFSMGGAVLQGKYYLWLTFPQTVTAGYVTQFSHWNTLMGDGSLELWTKVPQDLSVVYEDVIPSGANYYEVAVLDSISNSAENAWVTLLGEDNEFVATAYCDFSGSVRLDLDGATDGDHILTVTKHDHIPFSETVTIEQVEQYVDIDGVIYDDETGNGNVNPGETVEVMLTLANTGSAAVSAVNVIMESNSDYVNILTTEIVFGDIASGGTATAATGFEVEFAAALQGGVEILTELTITDADDNEWTTWLQIPIEGPSLYASSYTIDGDGVIDPGETEEIYFTLKNNGNLQAEGINGLLICNNRRITILDSLGNFGTIAAGGTGSNVTNRFTVSTSTAILPGTYIPFIIQLTTADGYDSFITMNVPIGEPEVTDPYGPDEYGYWCYDDEDTDYDKYPEYDWIEIDPDFGGDGAGFIWETGLNMGTEGGTGTYANLELPDDFTFVFYGEEYNDICVCTNGWVAPGHHESGNFMNYPIPGPQGPSPMIAVFWDDLAISNGDILWHYDEDLHYYVVEWSRIMNGDTSISETFEVILYDPIYYPTTTGDSEIKMQFLEVTNNNVGSYPSNHGQYCTTGLENEDAQIGLQYTFNNTYPEACKHLEDNMAILFTPPPIPPDGPFLSISNFSAFAGDDHFIEAGETAFITLELENMGAVTAHNIEVELAITNPFITITDNTGNYMEIPSNSFGLLENAFTLEVSENIPDGYIFYLEAIISCDEDSWNWLLPFTAYWVNTFAVDQDSVYFQLQPFETGSHAFTLTNIGDLPVNFYVRTDETTPAGRDITGSMITCDTDSFTPGEETIWTFNVYSAATDNEWVSDVWLDFPLGVTVLDASDVEGGSGGDMIWDNTTGAGQRVNWHGMTANGWGVLHDGEVAVWEVDVLLSTEFAEDMTLDWEIGGDGYGEEPHNVTGEIYMLYPLRWINLDSSSGNLEDGEDVEITMNFDTNDIEEGIHTCDIVITCDSWDTKIINVVLNLTNGDDNNSSELPEAVTLNGNYPNPFNPETEIKFQLPDNTDIILSVYNLKGQLVRTLVNSNLPGGSHSIIWDGKTNNSEMVGSGVYFYKLTAGETSKTRKMILLK